MYELLFTTRLHKYFDISLFLFFSPFLQVIKLVLSTYLKPYGMSHFLHAQVLYYCSDSLEKNCTLHYISPLHKKCLKNEFRLK